MFTYLHLYLSGCQAFRSDRSTCFPQPQLDSWWPFFQEHSIGFHTESIQQRLSIIQTRMTTFRGIYTDNSITSRVYLLHKQGWRLPQALYMLPYNLDIKRISTLRGFPTDNIKSHLSIAQTWMTTFNGFHTQYIQLCLSLIQNGMTTFNCFHIENI